jgi:DNA-binding response OmpR family regulator
MTALIPPHRFTQCLHEAERIFAKRGTARCDKVLRRLDLASSGVCMRVLLVEDNRELAGMLAERLTGAGYELDYLATRAEAQEALTSTCYAALILDLGLPDGDGLSVLREIRHRDSPMPVLILTARSTVDDRVCGLRSGADDYLTKPFDFDELLARLEALLRRPGQLLGSSLHFGNVTLDTQSRQVFINDMPQVLFPREMTVLELLIRCKERVVSKTFLEDHIFGLHGDVSSNAVEVYVHRLRKQLSHHRANIGIHTIRGVGYLLSKDV